MSTPRRLLRLPCMLAVAGLPLTVSMTATTQPARGGSTPTQRSEARERLIESLEDRNAFGEDPFDSTQAQGPAAGSENGREPGSIRDRIREEVRGTRLERGRERGGGAGGLPDREALLAVLRDVDPELSQRLAARMADLAGGEGMGAAREGRGLDREAARGQLRNRDGDVGRGGAEIRELFQRMALLTTLKDRDPELYALRVRDIRLERDTDALVGESRRIRGDASIEDPQDRIEDLREELGSKVEAHFELRQEILAAELQRLEARLEQLREELERREDDKDALIAARLAELRDDPLTP